MIKDGVSYIFYRHTPLRDGENDWRLGHPVFAGEDIPHSQSGAINLPYLWEAGPEFACSETLLAAYVNSVLLTLGDPTADHPKSRAWPRSHIDSPWYLAASGRERGPARRLGESYYGLLAFAPHLMAVNRRYFQNDAGRGHLTELMLLYAGHIYRVAISRSVAK